MFHILVADITFVTWLLPCLVLRIIVILQTLSWRPELFANEIQILKVLEWSEMDCKRRHLDGVWVKQRETFLPIRDLK